MPEHCLTAAQAEFAETCVAQGRFASVAEVVQAGLQLLHQQQVAAFQAMLRDVVVESDAKGWVELDDALARMDAVIDAAEARARKTARG